MEKIFKFDLLQLVIIKTSYQEGTVVGRCDNIDCADQFLVEYKTGNGNTDRSWFFESQLEVTN